ncbi:uncharacterized protein [Aristolochia californica]|uniref:uncharacterized protein n=1 Tax=Aristolochia californica TaxID=171875 RepID=UPI0035DEFD57
MGPIFLRHQLEDTLVVVDNGIFRLTLSKPGGSITGIQYRGIGNLLEYNTETMRGYWDLVWSDSKVKGPGKFDVIQGTIFTVIKDTEDQVELSFKRTWNSSLTGIQVPLNIDKRFVVLRGSSGFYSYGIYERLPGWPGFLLSETRIAFKLRDDKFHYMVADDSRFHHMPMPEDRKPPRGRTLAYKEAVLLVDPMEPELKGVVDDKYQYSNTNKDNRLHGWICEDPPIGFWQITATNEFRVGGPMKQELTSHVGPTMLSVFHSAHYAGMDLVPYFENGEPWKKVYGPVFFYLNSVHTGNGYPTLWDDAKRQMATEVKNWPYSFPASEDFPPSNQRGSAGGRLLVKDRYVNEDVPVPAAAAYVGLALPGEVGSWQTECKSYQFWIRTNPNGSFSIRNVRPGNYNLYAWVPGFIGDYKKAEIITISPGREIDLGDLVYEPPRDGPTLWEIGFPDRTALEFFIPDTKPIYYNKFLSDPKDRFRQYGLWEKYEELYPNGEPVYNVGFSDYHKDWFFAHMCRKLDSLSQCRNIRQIKFNLSSAAHGTYKLRVAYAAAMKSVLEIRLNNPGSPPLYRSKRIGGENVIARHGIHGLYRLFTIDVQSDRLVQGENTIFLTQTSCLNHFQGVLYDYVRLEAPA